MTDMSMISAQIDELRERAKVLRQGRWSDGADDARLMEDAADTIWQLRDDLQRTNAENAKLRELVADVREALCLDKTSLFREAIIKSLEDDMRELGIEVES